MRYGINTFLFTSPFTNESAAWFKTFRKWGFDSVEIAVEHESHIDPIYIKSELNRHGLVSTTLCGAYGPGRDLRGTKEDQQACLDYVHHLIDIMGVLDCSVLVGPLYSVVGRAEYVPPQERKAQWQLVVKNLKTLCRYAEKKGKLIALEPLNRFETDFINTCDQAIRMVKDVGSSALTIHLDTFHMNIEEKNQAAAIRRAGKLLGHLHACGSDRGTPGNDHIDWKGIARALKAIGYKRDISIESFTPDVLVIAKAAAIWREMEPRKNDIAINGLKFLKKTIKG
ncbi:MAG: sugar phosphate isomerase/epimerase [Terriglobia bacterium]